MDNSEKTEDALEQLIRSSNEGLTVEHKLYGKWEKDSKSGLLLVRSLLALANTPSGGYLINGIHADGSRTGITNDVASSYKHDDISRVVRNYSDPMIRFSVVPKKIVIDGVERTFLVFIVEESEEVVVCVKQGMIHKDGGANSDNLALREKAIYIRGGNPVESAEPESSNEWKRFVEQKMSQQVNKIREKIGMFCVPQTSNLSLDKNASDEDEFARQRNNL